MSKPRCDCLQCRITKTINAYQAENPAAKPTDMLDDVCCVVGQIIGTAYAQTMDTKMVTHLIEHSVAQIAFALAQVTRGAVQVAINETNVTEHGGMPERRGH